MLIIKAECASKAEYEFYFAGQGRHVRIPMGQFNTQQVELYLYR
jgi:sarcosine oxidase delta subunit